MLRFLAAFPLYCAFCLLIALGLDPHHGMAQTAFPLDGASWQLAGDAGCFQCAGWQYSVNQWPQGGSTLFDANGNAIGNQWNFPQTSTDPNVATLYVENSLLWYTRQTVNISSATSLSASFTFAVTGSPTYVCAPEAANDCSAGPMTTRLWMAAFKGQSYYQFFSTDIFNLPTVAGTYNWNPNDALDPSQWIFSNGEPATLHLKAWNYTRANLAQIGPRYGGGFFAGHGGAIQNGTGTLRVQLTGFAAR